MQPSVMKNLGTFRALILCGFIDLHAHAVRPRFTSTLANTDYEIDAKRLGLRAATPPQGGTLMDSSGWKVTCDSEENENKCSKAIDKDDHTFWHSASGVDGNAETSHSITVDMGSLQNINGVSVVPRQDGNDSGRIAQHDVSLSTDGENWEPSVAAGTWYLDGTEKYSDFEMKRARYVRLVAVSKGSGDSSASIAELKIYKAEGDPTPNDGVGQWGPTIDLPLIPVAGAVVPTSGKVLLWSSYKYDGWSWDDMHKTYSAVWDPVTKEVTQREVTNTDHDMFCPGITMGAEGQVIVTGGSSAKKTTLYNPANQAWMRGGDMNVPRGYQSSAICSDGRVFTIGGSWHLPNDTLKNGEIYNTTSNIWTELPEAEVKPMLTAYLPDGEGYFFADNHAWLFGWKNGTVFQAGPSTAMNWYFTDSKGGYKPAGQRKSGERTDPDSMCGNAVMYDAVEGKVLTVGGSPKYHDNANATAHAHVISIGNPGLEVKVALAGSGDMNYARTYHTSVVLPDGTVFVTGGQGVATPWTDKEAQLTPELYDPKEDKFIKQQPNSIPRGYHSISLLLPDATVFNGGGGLQMDGGSPTPKESKDHFDAQIFTPQYLYDGDGKLATRPAIQSVLPETVTAGGTVTITTDCAIKSASLIRYGTATHAINTDQRRVPLTLSQQGSNKYSMELPNDLGVLLPGYWMLFAMNEEGVPSKAATVRVAL